MMRPTYEDVLRAQRRLAVHLPATPVIRTNDARGWLKLENVQKTGAYKVRGALNALLAQVERGDHRNIIAASAGNHSAGVAWAATRVGLKATAVVPETAPEVKINATRSLGAEVLVYGKTFDESAAYAKSLARRRGQRFLPAFDDPDVIAGQGTIALELLHLNPTSVHIPVGGGGLISGMGLVLKEHGVHVVGVQVKGVDAMHTLLAGKTPQIPRTTLADGTRVCQPGLLTRRMCRQLVSEFIIVPEHEVAESMVSLANTYNLVVEGAGALAPASLRQSVSGNPVAVISGGNVGLEQLSQLVRQRRTTEHIARSLPGSLNRMSTERI